MNTALAIAVALLLQDPKVELKWKFAKDAQLRWEMSQRITVESDAFNSDQQITYTLKQTVKELSDKGEATLETTIEALKFNKTADAENAKRQAEYERRKKELEDQQKQLEQQGIK